MPKHSVLFDLAFNVALTLVGAWGALQCFWPAKFKSLRDRLGRGYNPATPLGQMMERFQKESGFFSRVSGFSLLLIAIGALAWWWLGTPGCFKVMCAAKKLITDLKGLSPLSVPLCLPDEFSFRMRAL
jgi:hypothetical protein